MRNKQLKKLFEESSHFFATRDQLTGLYNRLFFDEYYLAEVNRVLNFINNNPNEEERQFFAVSLLEIANLATINRQFGRATGDKVLKQLADNLNKLTFSRDIVSRYAGGKFAIIFINTNQSQEVKQKLEQIKAKLLAINNIDGRPLTLQLKLGSAFFEEDFIADDNFSLLAACEAQIK